MINDNEVTLFEQVVLYCCNNTLKKRRANISLPFSPGRSTRYSDRLHDFSVTIPRCYKNVYVNSFFPHKVKIWKHIFTVGSF